MKNALKTYFAALGVFALIAIFAFVIVDVMAQPIPSMRLRDLQDVRHLVPPANGDALVWNSAAGKWTNGAAGSGGIVGLASFNLNQFRTNGGTVSIKSGALQTNLTGIGTATIDGAINSSSAVRGATIVGTNQVTAGAFLMTTNAGAGKVLTSDGSGFGTWQPVSGDVTNTYNTIITTNLTVLNSLTVSSIVVTNVTVQNNLTVSNLYTVNGNHNTLVVTQYVRLPWTNLVMTGSNVATLDLGAASMFKLTMTADAFIGAPTGLPGTNIAQTFQLFAQQDGSGGHALTLTNSYWHISGSGTSSNAVVSVTTNANAITVLTFTTSPFSSTRIEGVVAAMEP